MASPSEDRARSRVLLLTSTQLDHACRAYGLDAGPGAGRKAKAAAVIGCSEAMADIGHPDWEPRHLKLKAKSIA